MLIRTGDVIELGSHRLMCGDAGNPEHVAKLFGGAKPDLVFTSPPYLQQRQYGQSIDCWDTMMQRVFAAMPWHDTTQVLVNLGLVHRKGEWMPYWDDWIAWMRAQGWRRFGFYIWDKGFALPRESAGRLGCAHENVFHFNRKTREPNKTHPCKSAGRKASQSGLRAPYGHVRRYTLAGQRVGPYRVADGLFRITREMRREKHGHPAVFPVALPRAVIESYTTDRDVIYDPFCGSGTSIIAAEQTGRVAYGMEIHAPYVQMAVNRYVASAQQTKMAL